MVKTYQQRHPELFDENGKRKPKTYICDNCGKVERAWRLPTGWIGAIPNGYCSDKCYSEHLDKVIEAGRST